MANRKISQFADIGALNATQYFPVEDTSLGTSDAANKRVQLSSLLALVGGASLTANQLFTGQNTFGDASPNGLSSYSSRLNVVEDGGNGLVVIQSYSNTAGHGSELQLYRARGTAAAQSAVSAGDTVGTIRYTVTSGFLNYTGAELRVTATGGSPQFGQAELGVYLGDGSGSASQIARFNGRTLLIGNNALSAFGGSNLLVVGGVNNPFPPSAAMVYVANQTSGDIPLVLHGHPVNTSGSLLELRTGSGTGTAKVFAKQGGTATAAVNVVFSDAALATSATDGFPYLPTCAGTPTGTPTGYTGTAPVIIDSTNQRLYAYSGGAWRKLGDVNGVTASAALTAGRLPFVASGGVLTDSANLSYSSGTGKAAIASGAWQVGTPDTPSTAGASLDIDRVRFRTAANFHSSLRQVAGSYDLQAWNENAAAAANFQADRFVGNYLYSIGGWRVAGIEDGGTFRAGYSAGGYTGTALDVEGPSALSNPTARITTASPTSLALTVELVNGQTADGFRLRLNGTEVFALDKDGKIKYASANSSTTVGAAGGAAALPANPAGYVTMLVGGTAYKVPYYNS
jgi:hypothetical protein